MRSTTQRPASRLSRTTLVAVVVAALLVLAACGADEPGEADGTAAEGSGERISLVDDGDALRWGDGSYGVVLAHGAAFDAASWQDQAVAIADQGASVIAVEDLTPEAMTAAVDLLRDEGAESVALVGGSAGADAALRLLSDEPDLVDQLVTLSVNSVVDGLGDQPKLFIASEEEPVADVSVELAETAPGDDNEVLLLPGADHAQNIFDGEQAEAALTALLERLDRG
ncbi:Alpha/beta hydrolase family protein [Nocardioides dokdonensis FR1436]|uniref:Alpha/beta hydrolase family protein n=1 Tax=Nocardioides dokdonensis FR1436 TaxID=1300347 RepID=A0A1A9GLW6_9ACTN|nr:alpha/beta hydrolase [Nocardioides dokdonensis]ANH38445.1 Alpha/beta hydrolase family protein [Nocardioides dokdonensis FR1436]